MNASPSKIVSALLNGILVICAIGTTAMVAQSRFKSSQPRPELRRDAPAIPNWQPLFEQGRVVGTVEEPAAIVIFSDYECPACKVLHERVLAYQHSQEANVSVVYRHLPLPSHRSAEQAAVASECSAEQQRFEEMHSAIFDAQSTLGIVRWSEVARKAGVPDLSKFEACMSSDDALQRVRRDVAIARGAGMLGTPTVVFRGGKQYTGVPPKVVLDSVFESNALKRLSARSQR